MTTYEEISTSRMLNRAFWNQQCRYVIANIREAQRVQNAYLEARYRKWLADEMQKRADFSYLGT